MAFFIFLMMMGYRLAHTVPDGDSFGSILSWCFYLIGFVGVDWLYNNLKKN